MESLKHTMNNIDAALKQQESPQSPIPVPESLIKDLIEALKQQDGFKVNSILDELNGKHSDSKTKEALQRISIEVLKPEYENALKIAEELVNEVNHG
jgi:hypothetical protein